VDKIVSKELWIKKDEDKPKPKPLDKELEIKIKRYLKIEHVK
jgi:hypothetical protein